MMTQLQQPQVLQYAQQGPHPLRQRQDQDYIIEQVSTTDHIRQHQKRKTYAIIR